VVSTPTPPAAPLTAIVSPGFGWATSISSSAVVPATYSVAAASQSSPSGFGAIRSAGRSVLRLRVPLVGQADHGVPNGHARDAVADGAHQAREVAALPLREPRRVALVERAGPDGDLPGVRPGGHHPHDHLARAGHRPRHLDHLQDALVPVLLELHGLRHASILRRSTAFTGPGEDRAAAGGHWSISR